MGCSAGTEPQWSENYLWEGSGAAGAQQWEGEEAGDVLVSFDAKPQTP